MTRDEMLKVENNYTVYMHKNKINDKVYIGITKMKPEERWKNGWGYYTQLIFWRAICKYTFDGFEHIILFEKLAQEQAEQKEIELIDYYKSTEKEFGYNISKGGMVNNGVPCKEETKKKISIANKGTKNGMYGKKHNKEIKEKISKRSKELWKDKNYREKILKILNNNRHDFEKGHTPWNKGIKCKPAVNRKKVICIETNEIFNSIKEAETIKNVNNVSYCCNRKRKSTKGLHFKFYEE